MIKTKASISRMLSLLVCVCMRLYVHMYAFACVCVRSCVFVRVLFFVFYWLYFLYYPFDIFVNTAWINRVGAGWREMFVYSGFNWNERSKSWQLADKRLGWIECLLDQPEELLQNNGFRLLWVLALLLQRIW